MNIFFLSWNFDQCAKWHGDKHVGKMALEGTQLLCNAISSTGKPAPYKPTHMNHPCSVWVKESRENWVYLRQLVRSLGSEFEHRFGKRHKSAELAKTLIIPDLPSNGITRPPLVMPESYHSGSVIGSYRKFYISEKSHLHQWTNRDKPYWITS